MPKIGLIIGETNNPFANPPKNDDTHDPKDHTHPPIRTAAIDILRQRYADYATTHLFSPGDVVEPKLGFDKRPECMQHHPFVFVRYLDDTEPADLALIKEAIEHSYFSTVNCIVFQLVNDGSATMPMPEDANNLRPVED